MLCLQGKEFIADNKESQSTTLAANVSSVNEELRGIIDSLHAGEMTVSGAAGLLTCCIQRVADINGGNVYRIFPPFVLLFYLCPSCTS